MLRRRGRRQHRTATDLRAEDYFELNHKARLIQRFDVLDVALAEAKKRGISASVRHTERK